MKYKANGGYQILNFEGESISSITSLDFKKIKDAILREKTFQIVGLSPQSDVKANANCEVSYDSDNDVCIIKVLDNTIVVSNDNSVVVSPIEYGTSVEANVQLVGDEPNLSSIQIGDDKYKVSQVSPSTSQIYDEEIDKLKIDGTIYKIGGGTTYYSYNGEIQILANSYASNPAIRLMVHFVFPEYIQNISRKQLAQMIKKYYGNTNIDPIIMGEGYNTLWTGTLDGVSYTFKLEGLRVGYQSNIDLYYIRGWKINSQTQEITNINESLNSSRINLGSFSVEEYKYIE